MRKSFRFKIISLSIVTICIMLAGTMVVWYGRTSRNAQISMERYIGSVLVRLNGTFDMILEDVDDMVMSLSAEKDNVIDVIKDRVEQSPLEKYEGNLKILGAMMNSYQFKSYIEGIMITTPEDRFFRVGSIMPYKELTQQSWYYQVDMKNSKSVMIAPHFNGSDNVISIARNIYWDNQILGVIKADIDYRMINGIYGVEFENLGSIYILDVDNKQLIYPIENASETLEKELLMYVQQFGEEGSFYADIAGVSSLIIYDKSAYTGWITVGVVPKSEVMREFRNVSMMAIVLSVLFGLWIIAILYFLLSRQMKNVSLLCGEVEKIDGEKLEMETVIHSGDEIEFLQNQIILMVERIRQLVSRVEEEQKNKRKQEMKILQNQINPHFLYNTLNTIKYLAFLQNADNIVEVAEGLSILMKNNMKMEEYLTIDEEICNIESYLKIQEFKYSGKFKYKVDKEIEIGQCVILKMLIQPLVENSLKHGIEPMDGMGIIIVKIFAEQDGIVVEIVDNGVGMSKEKVDMINQKTLTDTGIGISNVIKRINLYYGELCGLTVESGGMGTRVELKLPILKTEDVNLFNGKR